MCRNYYSKKRMRSLYVELRVVRVLCAVSESRAVDARVQEHQRATPCCQRVKEKTSVAPHTPRASASRTSHLPTKLPASARRRSSVRTAPCPTLPKSPRIPRAPHPRGPRKSATSRRLPTPPPTPSPPRPPPSSPPPLKPSGSKTSPRCTCSHVRGSRCSRVWGWGLCLAGSGSWSEVRTATTIHTDKCESNKVGR